MKTVAICVCTYRRPLMLLLCLESLRKLRVPIGARFEIIVVDNEPEPAARARVEEFARSTDHKVTYIHQPKRGISAARNAALDASVEIGADWIAFIDDDEKADRDWILQLMHRDYLDTPILRGVNEFLYPIPRPYWAVTKESRGREGAECKTATTANVRISADIARAGLRFDESFGLSGGEDSDFFTRAHEAGWPIKSTLRAITYERAHPERLTFKGQTYRAYWCAAAGIRAIATRRGWLGAVARKAHSIPLHVTMGTLQLIASPAALVLGQDAFKRAALDGGRRIAKGLGRAAAFVGILPQPYRVTLGR